MCHLNSISPVWELLFEVVGIVGADSLMFSALTYSTTTLTATRV